MFYSTDFYAIKPKVLVDADDGAVRITFDKNAPQLVMTRAEALDLIGELTTAYMQGAVPAKVEA